MLKKKKKTGHLCIDVNTVLTEEPQTGLSFTVHTDHSSPQLGVWFGPRRNPRPTNYHQVECGPAEMVPVTEQETCDAGAEEEVSFKKEKEIAVHVFVKGMSVLRQ